MEGRDEREAGDEFNLSCFMANQLMIKFCRFQEAALSCHQTPMLDSLSQAGAKIKAQACQVLRIKLTIASTRYSASYFCFLGHFLFGVVLVMVGFFDLNLSSQ